MSGRARLAKIFFIFVFALLSVQNVFVGSSLQKAYAAGCASPSTLIPTQIALYNIDESASSLAKPTTPNLPQTIFVGQQSLRYVFELEDASLCPANAPAGGVNITVASSLPAVQFLSPSGVPIAGTTVHVNAGNARISFRAKGLALANPTVISAQSSIPVLNTSNAIENLTIAAPTIDSAAITFTNNPNGTSDTVSGNTCAVAIPLCSAPNNATPFDQITIHAYSDSTVTNQLGIPTIADPVTGTFPPIASGDDQYRQVWLSAEYQVTTPAGTPSVFSTPVAFDQPYPSTVIDLTVTRGANDRPVLSWSGADTGASFVIYRADLSLTTPKLLQIDTSPVSPYNDSTASYVLGTPYEYVVRQSVKGSLTPESLPFVDSRLDLANVVFNPSGAMSTDTTPSVTFDGSAALVANPSVASVTYTNSATGAVYTASVTPPTSGSTQFSTGAPYIDAHGLVFSTLADGTYKGLVAANDGQDLGINDNVTNAAYTIDTVNPSAPVLSNLRYAINTVSGVAGSVEANAFVDIYTDSQLDVSSKLGTVHATATGSFSFSPAPIPDAGTFYIVARDAAGNESDATAFDVIHTPAMPDDNLLTMHQNTPGTSDTITGEAGAVIGDMTVRIFTEDPSLNPAAPVFRQVVAKADGSFQVNVGDNTAADFWVAVWSGAGYLSEPIDLSNQIAIDPPDTFTASAGDGSVTLQWSTVPDASFYTVETYNISTKQNLQTVTVNGDQTALTLTLLNGSSYRFYIHAHDIAGNSSIAKEVEATPHQLVLATTKTTKPASPKKVAQSVPAPVSVESAPETNTGTIPTPTAARDWTTWIIVGLGVVLLALAAFFGWQVWFKEPTAMTVVTVLKKPNRSNSASTSKSEDAASENKSPPEKPRW